MPLKTQELTGKPELISAKDYFLVESSTSFFAFVVESIISFLAFAEESRALVVAFLVESTISFLSLATESKESFALPVVFALLLQAVKAPATAKTMNNFFMFFIFKGD
jgi:hypothetical protein